MHRVVVAAAVLLHPGVPVTYAGPLVSVGLPQCERGAVEKGVGTAALAEALPRVQAVAMLEYTRLLNSASGPLAGLPGPVLGRVGPES